MAVEIITKEDLNEFRIKLLAEISEILGVRQSSPAKFIKGKQVRDVGFCLAYDFPLIAVEINENGKQELLTLGAKNVLVQSDADFDAELGVLATELSATAIFDGVGGQIVNRLLPLLVRGSVIYSYGFIGDAVPFSFHTSMLALKNITIRPFANISTVTVRDPEQLALALREIGKLIHQPHFKTKIGQRFKLDEIQSAISYVSVGGGKAVLIP